MNTAPFDAHLLKGVPFVNRKGLRGSLRRIFIDRDKHVLMVEGPSGTGKSHSVELIRHIAEVNSGLLAVAYLDLKGETHARFKPNMLACKIMRQMGRSVLDVPRREDAASDGGWLGDLCDWLTGAADNSGKTWIVVLDGFHNRDLWSETQELVIELINRSASSPALRTVLLSYSDDQKRKVKFGPRIDYETLAPLSRQDLCEFVKTHGRASNPDLGDEDVEVVVDSIWNRVTTGGSDRTAQLADRIVEWVTS